MPEPQNNNQDPNGLMAPEQFAATIKAKYPQYKDMPDQQLTKLVLDKYPQYKDHVAGAPSAPSNNMSRVDLATGKPNENDPQSDLGAGVAKSVTGMGANIFSALSKVPVLGKMFDRGKVDEMKEFSKPSNGLEQGGKATTDIASLLVGPGAIKGAGVLPTLGRAATTGGLAGAQSGDPKDIAFGAAGSIGGDVLAAGGKALGKVPSELDRANKLANSAAREASGMENTKYKNAITGFRDAIKGTDSAKDAVNALTDHYDALPRAMQKKTAPIFDKLMTELGGNVSGGKEGMSKVDLISDYLKHHALYTAGVGGLYGGLRHGSMGEAAKGAALGAVAPFAAKAIPRATPVLSPLMRTAPAVENDFLGGQQK